MLGDDEPPPPATDPAGAAEGAGQAEPVEPTERVPGEHEQGERPDPTASEARRRRLADVFGDVLPEATEDDAPDVATGAGHPSDPAERWYSENRPPHHDRG